MLTRCPKAGHQISPAGPGAGMVRPQSALAGGQGFFVKPGRLLVLARSSIAVCQAAQTP